MGFASNATEIEDTVFECLKDNGINIVRNRVYLDYESSSELNIKARAEDNTLFFLDINKQNDLVISEDGKQKFDITPYKKPLKIIR